MSRREIEHDESGPILQCGHISTAPVFDNPHNVDCDIVPAQMRRDFFRGQFSIIEPTCELTTRNLDLHTTTTSNLIGKKERKMR